MTVSGGSRRRSHAAHFLQKPHSPSKMKNVAMRQRAIQYGLKLNEYELAGPAKNVPCKEEEDLYRALDLDYVPPELREAASAYAAMPLPLVRR